MSDDLSDVPPPDQPRPDQPSPYNPPASAPSSSDRDDRSSRRSLQILTAEQCLAGISQLACLVMLDYLKPAQANAMRAAYSDVLRHHQTERRGSGGALPTDTIIDLVREDPRLLNILEQCLTDEQFRLVSEQIRADHPA